MLQSARRDDLKKINKYGQIEREKRERERALNSACFESKHR